MWRGPTPRRVAGLSLKQTEEGPPSGPAAAHQPRSRDPVSARGSTPGAMESSAISHLLGAPGPWEPREVRGPAGHPRDRKSSLSLASEKAMYSELFSNIKVVETNPSVMAPLRSRAGPQPPTARRPRWRLARPGHPPAPGRSEGARGGAPYRT